MGTNGISQAPPALIEAQPLSSRSLFATVTGALENTDLPATRNTIFEELEHSEKADMPKPVDSAPRCWPLY